MTRQQKARLTGLPCIGRREARSVAVRALYLLLVVLPLGSAGCLAVAAGAAAGGAAAYFYYKGKACQDFPSSFPDTWAAVQSSLQELSLPLVSNQNDGQTGTITTSTSDHSSVTIDLEVLPSRIRAEGTLTRVCIRVGTFGDEAVSARILAQISAHLVPAGGAPAPVPAGGQPVPAWTPVPAPGSPAPPGGAPRISAVPSGPIRPVTATAPANPPETAEPQELPKEPVPAPRK
jgi:Protein of unknown function (DUF3568)